MPRVQCLSCGEVDTTESPGDAGPRGDWQCENCDYHVARPAPGGQP